MDKMQSKQQTLREETLTRNTLNCMVCVCHKKHPINKIPVIMHTRKFKGYMTWTVNYSCVQFVWVEGSGGSELDYI